MDWEADGKSRTVLEATKAGDGEAKARLLGQLEPDSAGLFDLGVGPQNAQIIQRTPKSKSEFAPIVCREKSLWAWMLNFQGGWTQIEPLKLTQESQSLHADSQKEAPVHHPVSGGGRGRSARPAQQSPGAPVALLTPTTTVKRKVQAANTSTAPLTPISKRPRLTSRAASESSITDAAPPETIPPVETKSKARPKPMSKAAQPKAIPTKPLSRAPKAPTKPRPKAEPKPKAAPKSKTPSPRVPLKPKAEKVSSNTTSDQQGGVTVNSAKSAKSAQHHDDREAAQFKEVIRCVDWMDCDCKSQHEPQMPDLAVQCETCDRWLHTVCMG